jgi:hypothetical protein
MLTTAENSGISEQQRPAQTINNHIPDDQNQEPTTHPSIATLFNQQPPALDNQNPNRQQTTSVNKYSTPHNANQYSITDSKQT